MTSSSTLTEQQVEQGFHLLLKHALSHATQEGLIKEDDLRAGNADIQIVGPGLTLFYAALLSKGNPPSITSPDNEFLLSSSNCPPSFLSFFQLWQGSVASIQSLDNECRQDLTLLLCEKEPESSPLQANVTRLATDLKTVAISIAQRRTFALRFGEDLDHALNAHRPRNSGESARTEYLPPPEYEGSGSYTNNPNSHNHDLKQPGGPGSFPQQQSHPQQQQPSNSSPQQPPLPARPNSADFNRNAAPPQASSSSASQLTPSDLENLSLIRETLFSSFADCFATTPSLTSLFSRGPSWASRALFSTLNLAIMEVCCTRISSSGVKAVQIDSKPSKIIRLEDCPTHLKPFLFKLIDLGAQVQTLSQEDDERAMKDAENGRETVGVGKVERLKSKLIGEEESVEEDRRRKSIDDQVARISNEINRLSIAIIELPSFATRAKAALEVLTSVKAL